MVRGGLLYAPELTRVNQEKLGALYFLSGKFAVTDALLCFLLLEVKAYSMKQESWRQTGG